MADVIIHQIRRDANHRLRVKPVLSRPSGYDYIYRDASSVAWDKSSGELYVRDCPEFTNVDEFRQIVSAVSREYGDQLTLSASTEFVNVPSDIIAAFRKSS